jgi:hypothetical protein
MSAPGKTDLAQDWRVALKVRDEELDRLAHLSDDEFERAMAELPEPSHMPMATELAGDGRMQERVQASDVFEERRFEERGSVSPMLWLLAAAFALILGAGIAERSAVIAFFKGPTPVPEPTQAPKRDERTPVERAEVVRAEARDACQNADWFACSAKLNAARELDPDGESTPGVQQMRKQIEVGLRTPDYGKPPRRPQ